MFLFESVNICIGDVFLSLFIYELGSVNECVSFLTRMSAKVDFYFKISSSLGLFSIIYISDVLSKNSLLALDLNTDLCSLADYYYNDLESLRDDIATKAASLTCLILSNLNSPILLMNCSFTLK